MEKNPIKYLLIGDSSTGQKLTEYSTIINSTKKDEIEKIFAKICKTAAGKFEERNKITSKTQNYYFITFQPSITYLVLVNNTYPERLVFELIDKINQDKIPNMINEETKEINEQGKQALKNLVEIYQDNIINSIQNDVNDIKLDMKDNIKKMIESIEDTSKLEQSAEALRDESLSYKKTAIDIRRLTFWQNMKLWFILGGVILLLIALILFLIF